MISVIGVGLFLALLIYFAINNWRKWGSPLNWFAAFVIGGLSIGYVKELLIPFINNL